MTFSVHTDILRLKLEGRGMENTHRPPRRRHRSVPRIVVLSGRVNCRKCSESMYSDGQAFWCLDCEEVLPYEEAGVA